MKTKPLNQIIDECIKYSIAEKTPFNEYSIFWRQRYQYTSNGDLIKHAYLTFNDMSLIGYLLSEYMNFNRFECK